MKTCTKCKIEKPLSEFYKGISYKGGFNTKCKKCFEEAKKEWCKTPKGKEYLWKKNRNNSSKKRGYKAKLKKYGLVYKDYESMVKEQNGICAICGIHLSELNKRFSVDHCHETDRVRGLLCTLCNLMLGCARDNPETLEKAAQYLKIHKQRIKIKLIS